MELLIILVLLVINGLLAMSEMSIVASRQVRLEQAAAKGDLGAAAAFALAKSPSQFLSTIQIGITAIGIFAGAFGEAALAGRLARVISRVDLLEPYANVLALVLVVSMLTYFSLVIGELVPKRLAIMHPEAIASHAATPMAWLAKLAAPLVWLLSKSTDLILSLLGVRGRGGSDVSEEEIRGMIQKGTESGVIHETEQELVERVFRFGDRRVKSLMVPRADIVWIDENSTMERARLVVATSPHSHFPVCKGSLDSIVGIVHVKDILKHSMIAGGDFKIAQLARKPVFVPEAAQAIKVLESFRQSGDHVAFVVDEYGGIEGLLTLNDLVEAIVGDVASVGGGTDEPWIIQRDDGSWLVDGRSSIDDLFHTLGLTPPAHDELGDVTTAGGLVISLLGHVPRTGERVDGHALRFEVVDMDRRRVDKILVARIPAPIDDTDHDDGDDPASR